MAIETQNEETHDKRQRYHHGDLRAHLIETVRQLVEEEGVDGFSISQASRRAGVSSAAPYKHFADKNQIVRAVALDGIMRMGDAMRTAADSESYADFGKVTAIGMAYIRFARAEPGVFRLMFGLTEGHGKDEEMVACGHRAFGVLLEVVAGYLGPLAKEDEVLRRSYMLWSFVHGQAFLEIDGKLEAADINFVDREVLDEVSRRMLGPMPDTTGMPVA